MIVCLSISSLCPWTIPAGIHQSCALKSIKKPVNLGIVLMSFPTANYKRKPNTQTNGQTNIYLTRWHPFFSFFNWISELCIRKQSLIIPTFTVS